MRRGLPLLVLLSAGCYSYATVPPASAPTGRDVRVTLGDAGSASLTQLVGPRASSLDGRLLSVNDSIVSLSVSQVTRFSGVEETWNGESVAIPRSALASLASRRLSVVRSTILAAGIAGVSFLVVRLFTNDEDVARGSGRPGGGNPR